MSKERVAEESKIFIWLWLQVILLNPIRDKWAQFSDCQCCTVERNDERRVAGHIGGHLPGRCSLIDQPLCCSLFFPSWPQNLMVALPIALSGKGHIVHLPPLFLKIQNPWERG